MDGAALIAKWARVLGNSRIRSRRQEPKDIVACLQFSRVNHPNSAISKSRARKQNYPSTNNHHDYNNVNYKYDYINHIDDSHFIL